MDTNYLVIADNKAHYIAIDLREPLTMGAEKLNLGWVYTPRSSRSTKFQAKKLLKKFVAKMLRDAVREYVNAK